MTIHKKSASADVSELSEKVDKIEKEVKDGATPALPVVKSVELKDGKIAVTKTDDTSNEIELPAGGGTSIDPSKYVADVVFKDMQLFKVMGDKTEIAIMPKFDEKAFKPLTFVVSDVIQTGTKVGDNWVVTATFKSDDSSSVRNLNGSWINVNGYMKPDLVEGIEKSNGVEEGTGGAQGGFAFTKFPANGSATVRFTTKLEHAGSYELRVMIDDGSSSVQIAKIDAVA